MTDVEMSMDAAPGYDSLAAQTKFDEFLHLDKSRNKFVTVCQHYYFQPSSKGAFHLDVDVLPPLSIQAHG